MAYITLNKKYFFNNLDIIAQRSKGKDKIALVLKDNAYGHGLMEIATMAKEYGITKVVVRTTTEAQRVAKLFRYILVLADRPLVYDEKIHYTINDLFAVSTFPKGTKVELKVNTGMNRNGIESDEIEQALVLIQKAGLQLTGVFTHHSSADEDITIYEEQNRRFQRVKDEVKTVISRFGMPSIRFHSCNSAALFQTENFDEDLARVGIAAYGCLDMPENADVKELQAVLSVYAKRISLRRLKKGTSVGYGATYTAGEDLLIGNYDFGYGDGFLRAFSKGYVTPEGIELLGRISMDNSSFLTQKEELLIFDDAKKTAAFADTISYEVLTALKEKIPRVIR